MSGWVYGYMSYLFCRGGCLGVWVSECVDGVCRSCRVCREFATSFLGVAWKNGAPNLLMHVRRVSKFVRQVGWNRRRDVLEFAPRQTRNDSLETAVC